MGYRERRAHKQQQAQEALGRKYSSERRVSLPAPQGMNRRDDILNVGPQNAFYIENAVPDEQGLLIGRKPDKRATITLTGVANADAIVYDGSGSTSAEFWVHSSAKLWNVGEVIVAGTTAEASAISAPSCSAIRNGDYIQYNKTIIYVNGRHSLKWTRASGWESWGATVSAGNIHSMNGIGDFKQRIFLWKDTSAAFWYSSVDHVLGTFNHFDLTGILGGNVRGFCRWTKDGGIGPDDYAVFIGKDGSVAVYAGTDPADASNWSLVGTYKIGKPITKNSLVQYGSQVFVLCEDDVYVIPDDLTGKRNFTKARGVRRQESDLGQNQNGVYWPDKQGILYSDGTFLDISRGFEFTKITTDIGNQAWELEELQAGAGNQLAIFRNKVYYVDSSSVHEVFPSGATQHNAKIITAPIPAQGRAQIHLVNPVFAVRRNINNSASITSNIRYRIDVVYDNEHEGFRYASTSGSAGFIVSTSSNSEGQWVPGCGSNQHEPGQVAQLHIDVISASTSGDLLLKRLDFTFSDTGGL